jgi:hypothetical protein
MRDINKFLGAKLGKTVTSLAVATTAAFSLSATTYAATFSIISTNDASDSKLGDGICEATGFGCTLRAAIEESNAIIGFPPSVINLPAGIYELTLGELEIRNSLFLRGEDPLSTIIDGNSNSRIFSIVNLFVDEQTQQRTNPIVSMNNLTIQNGRGKPFVNGGGIFISQGSSLNITNSIVRNNQSQQFGGGISNGGILQIFNSTISDNSVPINEGGGQTASGGGIFNSASGSIDIDRSTISDNQATRGGGIRNAGGRLNITNSTISGNRASNRGGGIMTAGVTNIAYSTITKNEANAPLPGAGSGSEDRFGGGIYNDRGTVNIGNSILAGNTDNRSRFDTNFSPDCFSQPPEDSVIPGRFITSFRGNLVGVSNNNCIIRDTIFGTDISFDQVGTADDPIDPLLGSLANNGGLTQTHALLPSSPAIDRGNGITSARFFDCPSTDQRGAARPFDGDGDGSAVCDVGAYEFGASPKPVPEPTSTLGVLALGALSASSALKRKQKQKLASSTTSNV